MKRVAISACGSNRGKTILTTALLYHFRGSVRPFKVGPDFIDPQFHKRVALKESVNLDSFMMSKEQVEWIYYHYATEEWAVIEGVMGFYDGDDRGCSTYSIARDLDTPVVMLLDGSGSYITIVALLKGLLEYREDNTIKAVVINRVSSESHYELIKNLIAKEFPQIEVLGWIRKDLESLRDTHLGLDLRDLSKIKAISKEVLEHIDILRLAKIAESSKKISQNSYPFPKFKRLDKKIVIVNDENFSFLYHDNLQFLKEMFKEVVVIDSTKDEAVPNDTDFLYIPGGYVESVDAYNKIKHSNSFKNSIVEHSKTKPIYAECAGLLYLSKKVDRKEMSGVLDIEFELGNRFARLGYYYNSDGVKGHAFHYTKPTISTLKKGFDTLYKRVGSKGEVGSWATKDKKVFGTYLHTLFRVNPKIIERFFDGS